MTENHNLNTPQKGTSEWHIPLNENFNKIEDDVHDLVERIQALEQQN